MNADKFSESAKEFTKSPLGIIALFIVLVYGFASLVVGLGQGISEHITPLVYFMVFFPVIVFCGFLWLVANHHNKLYGPSDFRNEDNFMKSQMPPLHLSLPQRLSNLDMKVDYQNHSSEIL